MADEQGSGLAALLDLEAQGKGVSVKFVDGDSSLNAPPGQWRIEGATLVVEYEGGNTHYVNLAHVASAMTYDPT